MWAEAQARILEDGRRLHLHHGPIDIIAEAFGASAEVRRAYTQAAGRFATVMEELVAELALLRRPIGKEKPAPRGAIARRMVDAVWPHRRLFITPMAAVAGSVADEVLAAMSAGRALDRAYVNDGGDIAFHLAPGQRLSTGIVNDPDRPGLDAILELHDGLLVRGLATSGWRGRSFSFGIADAVTVLARTAAMADASATLVANAVATEHEAIVRRPARALRDDTDLGDRTVTVGVGELPAAAVVDALERGRSEAERLRRAGFIRFAYLALQGHHRTVGADGRGRDRARRAA